MDYTVGKAYAKARTFRDLRELLRTLALENGDKTAYVYRSKNRSEEVHKTYADLWEDVQNVGTYLQLSPTMTASLTAADRSGKRKIAILGDNSYHWVLAQNAALFGAGIAVPLDKQLALPEIHNLLERSNACILFLDGTKKEILESLLQNPSGLKHIIIMGEQAEPLPEGSDTLHLWSMEDVRCEGAALRQCSQDSFAELPLDPEATSAIFFTSGTTSQSKGVMISHRNICENVRMVRESIDLSGISRALSILPIHHTFENTAQYVLWEHTVCIYINEGLRYIGPNLKAWKIELLVCVPLLLENIYRQVNAQIAKKGKTKAVAFLRKLSRLSMRLGLDLRAKLFKPVREGISDSLKMFIVGAAPLKEEVQIFFEDIAVIPYVGYGMTECAPLISCNSNHGSAIGSAGHPCSGVEVKIDGNTLNEKGEKVGEILVRSGGIMNGYYEDPSATAAVMDEDGWLRTGDVGYIDKKGMIFITGREKSMIVLPNGKKVFPEEIELLLSGIPGVINTMAFGAPNARGGCDIAVLFQVNDELNPIELEESIYEANQKMPVYKSIKYWVMTKDPMITTSTLKVKRKENAALIQAFLEANGSYISDFHSQEIQLAVQ